MANVWKQLVTQSYTFYLVGEREGYVSKAFVCIARAFLAGLRNVFGSPMAAGSTQRLCDQAPPPVTESAPSADVMARQTAAGYRAPGTLLGGLF